MENKTNIAELLKDCPKGMELNCLMYEDVYFDYVDELNIIHCHVLHTTYTSSLTFNQHGTPNSDIKSKCVIFPKGKTTWEGFHKPFEDGDIVAFDAHHLQIFIFKDKKENNTLSNCYLMLDVEDDELYLEDGMYYVTRFATEEEKAKLFQAIKDNGYKWNPETKTLENLVEPWTIQYAKDGDVLAFDDETIVIFKDLYNNTSFHSYCHIEDGVFTISKEDMPDWWIAKGFYPATEEQCTLLFRKIKEAGYHWNPETKTLEKLTEFKDGDVAISDLGDIHLLRTKDSSYCAYRIRWTGLSKLDNTITTGVKVARLATEEEKQILFDSIKANGYRWNEETKSLEKLINKNKFVIGAIVTNGKIKGRICLRDGDSYVLEDGTHIFFSEVHNWELVSNKFDINTLKPFDKVLVRHNIDNKWCSSFFSHIDSDFHSNCYKYVTVAGKSYPMCIPYEGNEHLSGATNNCIEYYKTW